MPRLTRMGFTVRFHLAGSQPEDYGDGDNSAASAASKTSGRLTISVLRSNVIGTSGGGLPSW
jgi:hypothetical protein